MTSLTLRGALVVACVLSAVLAFAQPPPVAERPYQKGTAAYQAAVALAREKKNEEALAAYLQMAKDFPKHDLADDAQMQAAGIARALKQNDVALTAYEWVIANCPKSEQLANAYSNKASLLGAMGRYAEAAPVYQLCATKFFGSTSIEAWAWGAFDAYARVPDYPKAIAAVDAYLAADYTLGARRYQALRTKLTYLLNSENAAGVAATLAQLEQMGPDNAVMAEALRTSANFYALKTQEPLKAVELLRKASEYLNSGSAQADLYNAGARLAAAKMYAEAIATYRDYLKRFPRGIYAVTALSNIAAYSRDGLKDREQEIATYKEILANYADTFDAPVCMARMATAYNVLKDYDALEQTAAAMAKQYPGYGVTADTLYLLAAARRAQKDNPGARALCQMLVAEYDGTRAADSATVVLGQLP